MKFTRITVEANKMGGVPCIRGLRVPVATIVAMVADGMSEGQFWRPTRTWRPKISRRLSGMPPRPSANARYP